MDENLIARIRKTLECKSTEELRCDYEDQDLSAWSPEGLEAMRRILAERGVTDLHCRPPSSERPALREEAEPSLSQRPLGGSLFVLLIVAYFLVRSFGSLGGGKQDTVRPSALDGFASPATAKQAAEALEKAVEASRSSK